MMLKHLGNSSKMVIELTADELDALDRDNMGVCLACGSLSEGVEPDAYGYECEECDKPKVCGIENAVLMGRVRIVPDESTPSA